MVALWYVSKILKDTRGEQGQYERSSVLTGTLYKWKSARPKCNLDFLSFSRPVYHGHFLRLLELLPWQDARSGRSA